MSKPSMKSRCWLAAAGALFLASQAGAWGPLEHKAVALIAQDRLSPAARRALRTLLGGDAGLDRIAVCADDILYEKQPLDCGGVLTVPADPSKATRPWHVINIPVGSSAEAASVMDYCPGGKDCVVEQIRRHEAVLADPAASVERRRSALMFLVHLVGDAHQPLHCADDADHGGNEKKIVFLYGKPRSLHALWDDMVLLEDWRQQSTMDLALLVRELEADLAGRSVEAWVAGDFVTAAALESFRIANDDIYPRDAREGGQFLNEDYRDAMRPLAERRLEMAGVRLAALLERALGQAAPIPEPTRRRAPVPPEAGAPVSFDGARER